MTATLERPGTERLPADGGLPARRAVVRWAWRLFRREWRQQALILTLITLAVAATLVGATVATNTPQPTGAAFGTAQDLASFPGSEPGLAAKVAGLAHRYGRIDVIDNQTVAIPGSVHSYQLRAQNPYGPFGQPLLKLLAGHYPVGAGQVAVTRGLAQTFQLRLGGSWPQQGATRRVVGIVENPQNLLEQFALVPPGQLHRPTQVTVLFDASGPLGPNIVSRSTSTYSNPINPETITLALSTVLMVLVGLVAVAGFTVLAQRRLRSIAMLGAVGAAEKNIRLVVLVNGAFTGVVGAVAGFVIGLAVWLAYRPHLETSAHHLIGAYQLPWAVIAPAMALAVLATVLAAWRPARAIARVPIVTALAGRPVPPKQLHRSAAPGLVAGVAAFFLLGAAAANSQGGGRLELVLGLVTLIAAMLLFCPLLLASLARLTPAAPLPVRLAVRDLARYRARSGAALAAISLGILIATLTCVLAAARYADELDYAGPNLAANQLLVFTPAGPGANPPPGAAGKGGLVGATGTAHAGGSLPARAHAIAAALGAGEFLPLQMTDANLWHAAAGRQWNGPIYVATPALLAAFRINPARLDPNADILTMRPGIDSVPALHLVYGSFAAQGPPGRGDPAALPCRRSDCLVHPSIEEVSALPSGTAAPNTVITEHAIHTLHLHPFTAGWLIQTTEPLSAAQINSARLLAAASGLTIATRNHEPTPDQVINWATVFGIALALGVLAVTVGLIRSETRRDLRTLAATGASSATRRSITAATAGALALIGAALGVAAAYLAALAYLRNSALGGGIGALGNAPLANLLALLIGLPLIAAVAGWLLAGREPAGVSRQPIE